MNERSRIDCKESSLAVVLWRARAVDKPDAARALMLIVARSARTQRRRADSRSDRGRQAVSQAAITRCRSRHLLTTVSFPLMERYWKSQRAADVERQVAWIISLSAW
jgi:hypothetical protein